MVSSGMARLTDRGILIVSGPDHVHFLQNLVTCDIEKTEPGGLAFGALLTPQGKILFDFLILRSEDRVLIDLAVDRAEELARRLGFYRLRAKVEIQPGPAEIAVHASWGRDLPEGGHRDPRLPELGTRDYGPSTGSEPGDIAAYHAHRIRLGVPQGGLDHGWAEVFPHEALMDQINGVAFAKGCYVGQEVVSRMQHRGTARNRFVRVTGQGPLPEAGSPIEADGKPVGTMGSSIGSDGLALARLDRIAQARGAGKPILCNGMGLDVTLQPWVNYGWPQE